MENFLGNFLVKRPEFIKETAETTRPACQAGPLLGLGPDRHAGVGRKEGEGVNVHPDQARECRRTCTCTASHPEPGSPMMFSAERV